MELWLIVFVVAIAIAGTAVAFTVLLRERRRTERLSGRFGPEYRQVVETSGSRRRAEHELETRERRVGDMDLRPLSMEERDQFAPNWQRVQARFVDDPAGSITQADLLLTKVMATRGYRVDEDFEHRAADVSVDHPQVVSDYRVAHEIAVRNATDGVETEDLRQAMIHYRALFDELLEVADGEVAPEDPKALARS